MPSQPHTMSWVSTSAPGVLHTPGVVQFGASQYAPAPQGLASAGLQGRPASSTGLPVSRPASLEPLLPPLEVPLLPPLEVPLLPPLEVPLLPPLEAPLELPLLPLELPGAPNRSEVSAPLQATTRKPTLETHARKERRILQYCHHGPQAATLPILQGGQPIPAEKATWASMSAHVVSHFPSRQERAISSFFGHLEGNRQHVPVTVGVHTAAAAAHTAPPLQATSCMPKEQPWASFSQTPLARMETAFCASMDSFQ